MRRSLLLVVAGMVLSGCSAEQRQSADIAQLVVERAGEFGESEGDGVLSGVFDVDVSAAGEVFASEPNFSHVLVYGPDGRYRRTIGGKGDGPGEMQIPGVLWWVGDTLTVMDFRLGAHMFGQDGTFYHRVDMHLPLPENALLPVRPMFPLMDGSFGATAPATNEMVTSGAATHHVWLKVSREGQLLDTLLLEPLPGRLMRLDFGGGRPRSVGHPLPWNTLLAVAPDGSSMAVVDRTPKAAEPAFMVTRLSITGDTLASRAVAYEPVPLSEDEIEHTSTRLGERFAEGQGLTPARATALVRSQIEWPAHVPAVTAVLGGADGTTWLRREEVVEDSVRWDVLSPELEELGSFYVPKDFEAKVVDPNGEQSRGWSLYGIELDALDVPTIVRYTVTPAR